MIKLFDAHTTGYILALSTLVLLAFDLFFGNWPGFIDEFQRNKFIHGMSLAFCLFTLLFPYPTLLQDDMTRRSLTHDSQFFRWVAFIPLFDPLIYLCVRPPLLARRG